jgi:hypothetical protein
VIHVKTVVFDVAQLETSINKYSVKEKYGPSNYQKKDWLRQEKK